MRKKTKFGRVTFIKRVYWAISDFRIYPFILKEKLKVAVGYFLKLIFAISMIMALVFVNRLFEWIPVAVDFYRQEIPYFSIENGTLLAEENTSKEFNEDVLIVIDDEIEYANIENIEFNEDAEHLYYVIMISDAMAIGIRTDDGVFEIGSLLYEEGMNITKSEMLGVFYDFQTSNVSRIAVWLATTLSLFIAYLLVRIWTLVTHMLSIAIINIVFGITLKLKDYLKLAIYTSTLPLILEMIAVMAVGRLSETVNIITVLVSCVYIFYALRALKLDSFIIRKEGRMAQEKVKNALRLAQKELERQIAEMERSEREKLKEKREKEEQETKENEQSPGENEESKEKETKEQQQPLEESEESEKLEEQETDDKNGNNSN